MKKIKILLLCLLLNSVLLFSQNIINSIDVSGNKNVSREKILILMKMKPGGQFNEGILREDIKKIAESGFFSSVSYEIESSDKGIDVKVIVVENPVVKNIYFKGNNVFKTKDLIEYLGVNKGDILNEIKLLSGVEKIKEKYKEKQFYFAEVDYDTMEKEDGVILNVLINEQGRRYVSRIVFKGNKVFSDSRLRGLMKIKQRNMPFIRGSFKPDLFEKDIRILENFYKENGFLNAKVGGVVSIDTKSKGLKIEISVNEGNKYYVGDIRFEGNILVDDKELRNKLSLKKKGDIFNRKFADENLRNLSVFYINRGHLKVKVSEIPIAGEKPDVIDIVYSIEPGNVYTAGEIIVRGNYKTKDKVIRREVKILPGDKITSEKLQKSFNNLFDLNYFDKINIYPEFTGVNTADIVVDVEEKEKTGIFLIGGGYSSVDDVVGMISISQSNFDITNPPKFVGGGQSISLMTQLGTEVDSYKLSFTEPYFLDKPVWFGFDLYRMRKFLSDYTDQRTGGALRIGRRWEKSSLGLTGRIEEITLSDIDIPSITSQEGDYRKNSITGTFLYSALDRKRSPNRGIRYEVSVEYSGDILGGDVNFLKPVLENDIYYPLGKWTFHSKTYAGAVEAIGDTEEVPIYEKFFGGGIGTVRGYQERSLGPKDGDYPLGGQAIFAQNFELIYPLYQDILKGVLFFDVGNVWEDWDSIDELRKGVGAGIKVVIPFLNAPIEIYYGYALDRKDDEPESRWHIGMWFGF
ncbi:MAG: outer membrane protein assembly factor BamA [Candidatus Omnitrophica bacterium]|nr:outer membrane protein assembly factor BamA [Candidatus Omnitrophota bacterium]